MSFKAQFNAKINQNTSLKHFPCSTFQKFCNVIIYDVWEQIAAKIMNRNKTAPKFSYDDVFMFRKGRRPAEEMMNAWKLDNPSFADLMAILEGEGLLRAVTFIQDNVFEPKNKDVKRDGCGAPINVNEEKYNWDADKFEAQKKHSNTSKNIMVPYKLLSAWTNHFNTLHHLKGGNFIDSGGFADVFLGVRDGEKVAVKKFRHSEHKDQFENETILFDCNHSNLVRLLHLSTDGPSLCLVYEFVEAGSLLERLCDAETAAGLSRETRVKIAAQTASALHYLHGKAIVHRDIKSANILLTGEADVKVADFGISKVLQLSGATHVTTTTIVGTLVYMAPEYLFNHQVSPTIDMYSFGVVFLELLYGQPAYCEDRHTRSIIEMFEEGVEVDECWRTASDDGCRGGSEASGRAVLEVVQEHLVRLISRKKHLRPSAQEVLEALNKLQDRL